MMKRIRLLAALVLALVTMAFAACSGGADVDDGGEDDGRAQVGSGGSGSGQGGAQQASTTVGQGGSITVGVGGAQGSGGSCVDIEVTGEAVLKPADIIFTIDNSGSMTDEIASVEQNINVNFANIIGSSGIDYQVIMLTRHGSGSLDVCIGPPLSNSANCNGQPGDVMGQFHHYSYSVYSTDSLCKILNTLYGTNGGGAIDENSLHPEGWSKWLRQNAIKVFVEITDDAASCNWSGNQFTDYGSNPTMPTGTAAQSAILWDQQLLQAAPSQFGTTAARNYQFYSIIGLKEKPMPLDPYQPGEAINQNVCNSPSVAYNPGYTYQWLSKGTNGLRFPVCQWTSYDAVFQAIAAGVVDGAAVPCEFTIDSNEPVDPNSLVVEYTPGSMTPAESFTQVMGAAACGMSDQAFYLENDVVKLCPATCDKVTADNDATIKVIAQCVGTAE